MASLNDLHNFLGLIKEAYKDKAEQPEVAITAGPPPGLLVMWNEQEIGRFTGYSGESWIRVDTLENKRQNAIEDIQNIQGKDRLKQVVEGA